jgi:hypothetical protein
MSGDPSVASASIGTPAASPTSRTMSSNPNGSGMSVSPKSLSGSWSTSIRTFPNTLSCG